MNRGDDVAAIVPAAGIGRRFGGVGRKTWVRLGGMPLLAQTLRTLNASPAIRWIIVVVRPGQQHQTAALFRRYRISKALAPCRGGASRAASVARGLRAVPPRAGWVLVHDGARPCVSSSLITRVVQAARRHRAVACGLPAAVTVKRVSVGGRVLQTLPRERLWLIQTPQVFRKDWLVESWARAPRDRLRFPDDAAVVEAAGFQVQMVLGEPWNLKVTTREDLVLAEAILKHRRGENSIRHGPIE